MEEEIIISNIPVKFKASAGMLRVYRMSFKRDMITDLLNLQKKLQSVNNNEETFELVDLTIFENIAWSMAKMADPTIPNVEKWLDGFDTFSIYEILPKLSDMLIQSFKGISEKKNIIPQEVQNQH